jgi:hydrogenase maturation protein HypF
VLLEVEADPETVAVFLARLTADAPPLARVERVAPQERRPAGDTGFQILPSRSGGESRAPISADTATCEACLRELSDPADRRHRYPFINCTDCGPRFTIIRGVPYDRPLTTMAGFAMCPSCQAEYDDPVDRRFHAQPNACPACGPVARLLDAGGRELDPPGTSDAVAAAAGRLRDGAIVAVKGLGGYHLACRADDESAVATLRSRKERADKPFALMAADPDAARGLLCLGTTDESLLRSPARPIVLAPRRNGARVAASVAPGSADLGVMLPYSPLHHLLMADVASAAGGMAPPLVMTSGNVSDEPIAYHDDDARERLGGIADAFLTHNRPIHMRTDDSVQRTTVAGGGSRAVMLRRSRGYVPASLPLPSPAARHVLGCGAELKHTFCLAKERRAWVSHHIGDLKNVETLRSFREAVLHFERAFAVTPEVVAHDLHPDYLSTRYAQELPDVELIAVQHHHAHLAACAAEHGIVDPVVGAIFDGAGLGPDGTVWGGEILVGDLDRCERAGHLWPVRLPGGDAAAREPWRMACSWLLAGDDASTERPPGDVASPGLPLPGVASPGLPLPGVASPGLPLPGALAGAVTAERWDQVSRLVRSGFRAPITTSGGRLFDAVAALCGLRARVSYEGQAAVELEARCDPHERRAYALPVLVGAAGEPLVLDARALVGAVGADLDAGTSVGVVATRFHHGLADGIAAACVSVATSRNLDTVVLSGGVFQNRRLLERTASTLLAAGLRVRFPELLPPNDGGIAYGQAAIAAASLRDRT